MENPNNNNCNNNSNNQNQRAPLGDIDLTRFGTRTITPYAGLSEIQVLDLAINLIDPSFFVIEEDEEEQVTPQQPNQNNNNQNRRPRQ